MALKNTVIGFLASNALEMVRNVLSSQGDKVAEEAIGAVRKEFQKTDAQHRTDMWTFIMRDLKRENPEAAANLWRREDARQNCLEKTYAPGECYEPGDEEVFTKSLVSVYEFLDQFATYEAKMDVFQEFGMWSDEEFDRNITAFQADKIVQWMERYSQKFRKFASRANAKLLEGIEFMKETGVPAGAAFIRTADERAAQELWKLDSWLDQKGIR